MYRYLILISMTVCIAWCKSNAVPEINIEPDPYTHSNDTIAKDDSLADPILDQTPLPDNLDKEIITQPDVSF